MIKAYLRAGLVVWAARIAILLLLLNSSLSGLGKVVLVSLMVLLDLRQCGRIGRSDSALKTQTGWRATAHDGFLPSPTELVHTKVAFDAPIAFENEAAAGESITQAT